MASNSFLFIWYSFSVSGHAPPVRFVSKTPPHAKSDASQKSSVSKLVGGSNFPFGYYPSTILSHLLDHLIWDDENQSLRYKFLKL